MYPQIRKTANMTTNKHFNSYKEGPDVEFFDDRSGKSITYVSTAWSTGTARDGVRRDVGGDGRAGAVGGPRGVGLRQLHGVQRRGGL